MNKGGQRKIEIRNERFRKRKRYNINTRFIIITSILAVMYNKKQNVESYSFFRASAVQLGPRQLIIEVFQDVTQTHARGRTPLDD